MSSYEKKGKGWRYDFQMNKKRYTEAYFKTKTKAKQAEAKRREELKNPEKKIPTEKTQTDMGLLTLCNKRLDYVKKYNSEEHFRHVLYHIRRWIKEWKDLTCSEITSEMVETYIMKRSDVSHDTANKDLRYLRATFNYGIKRNLISDNPTNGIDFLPVKKKKGYVPPKKDVYKVISLANPDAQDYLWSIVLTVSVNLTPSSQIQGVVA